MDNCGNIFYGLFFGELFEHILGLNANKVQNLEGDLCQEHANCEECGNDCGANLGEPRCADLIGYVEYVNENDKCDEQQNNEYDANNDPYRYARFGSGVFDDCNHNVLRELGPTNDLCALGQLCVHCLSLTVVCNTVYEPGGSILTGSNEVFYVCKECGLVESFGYGVTVGQLERTVIAALNLVEHEVCRSACQGCGINCKSRTCGNGDNNFLISKGDSCVGNGNDNVIAWHCERVVGVYSNLYTTNGNNLNGSGVAFLNGRSNLNCFAGLCLCLINGCITFNGDLIVAVALFCYKLNIGSCDQIGIHVICKSLAVSILPGITGKILFDGAYKSCDSIKVCIHQLCDGIGVGDSGSLIHSAHVELYNNRLLCVDQEQVHIILCDLACIKAEPSPTVGCIVACRECLERISKAISRCIRCGVFLGQGHIKCAVYIIIYVVNKNLFSMVLSGNCLSGHSELESTFAKFLSVNNGLNIIVSGQRQLNNGTCNLFACFVPTAYACVVCTLNCRDTTKTVNGCIIYISVGIILEVVLINNGVFGEVRSKEGNGIFGCFNAGNNISTCVYKGLLLKFIFYKTCERQNELNAFAEICDFIYATESKIKGLLAAYSVGAIELVGESNLITGCRIEECFYHSVGNGYLLNHFISSSHSGQDKVLVVIGDILQECLGKFEGQAICKAIPVSVNSNGKRVFISLEFCKAFNIDMCVIKILHLGNNCNNFHIAINGSGEVYIIPIVRVREAEECIFSTDGKILVQFCSCSIQAKGAEYRACLNFNKGLCANSCAGFVFDDKGNRVFFGIGNYFNIKLYNKILCRHLGDVIAGCSIYPTQSALILGVIQHLIQISAYGQESIEDNSTVSGCVGYTVEVGYAKGNIKAGGHLGVVGEEHIQTVFYNVVKLGCYARSVIGQLVENLVNNLFHKCFCIKSNALFKLESRVATIEVHQAVIGDNVTNLGSHQTVCNLEGVALNKVVNAAGVLCLINNCSVEICERIVGCSCLLEQVLHIKFITELCSKLFDNVINGVVEVAVYLCGQTVGDLDAGNVFEFFYKYFKCRNGCECINKVLCFEVVGEIITGYSLNVGEENLCITGCECLVVYLAEESGINCFENSNDLFEGQAFCKCNKVIGLCSISSKDLVLERIHFGVGRILKSFEGDAQNACELRGDLNVSNQLAAGKADSTYLVKQSGKLCSCTADQIGAVGENKVKVDNLLLDDLVVFVYGNTVGEGEACFKQLTAVVEVCKLVQGGNEVFERIDQSVGQQLEVALFILCGDNSTVDFNLGDVVLESSNDQEELTDVRINIEHTKELLCDAGFVNDLYKLLNVDLGKESANIDSLNETFNIDNVGDLTVDDDALGNTHNIKDADECLIIGRINILGESHIAANSFDNRFYTDSVDSGVVALQTSNDVCGRDGFAVNDLVLDGARVDKISIAVFCSQLINVDNLIGNQFGERKQGGKIFSSIAKENNGKIKCSRIRAVTVEQLIIQTFNEIVIEYNLNDQLTADNAIYPIFGVEEIVLIDSCLKNSGSVIEIHILYKRSVTANTCQKLLNRTILDVSRETCILCDNSFEVCFICGILNLNTVKLNSLVDINNFKQLFGSKIQSQIHQSVGIVIDECICIDILDSSFDIIITDVLHHNVDTAVLDVGLQIHRLEQVDETVFVYASEQFVGIKAGKKLFYVDIVDNILDKSDNVLFGNDSEQLFLGHKVAKATACRDALKQSLNIAVLDVGQKRLGIDGNGNVGSRYVFFGRCLVYVHVQPIVSQHTERQNCQNSYEC